MFFLTPRHVKQGSAFIKDAKKLLAYKRDLWSDAAVAEFEAGIRKLEEATKRRQPREIEEAAGALDKMAGTLIKPVADAGLRENCEVFLVAIVIALGVRTYFLQPFTIPTGSMQPTLNGIIGHPTTEPPPNIVVRLFQTAVFGRTWVDVVSKTDDVILDIQEVKRFGFLTRTEIRCAHNSYVINCPKRTLIDSLRPPPPGQAVKAGEVITRGYHDTGDHVFVDKFSYNFRRPARGDVFVFNTLNIPTTDNVANMMQGPSQFYIKRLAGLPGDELRIASPQLFVNGKRAEGKPFERVMSAQDGYRGYAQGPSDGVLWKPAETFTLPEKSYFALGDNSYNSQDSRYWRTVPQQNIMGRGVLVYWPFTRHWGPIN
ncbi:MAG: Signal peptidase [Chthoniobacteraceae bacterium]|nr:Signal peptidase [Chthoniobacteraceae bacterium]